MVKLRDGQQQGTGKKNEQDKKQGDIEPVNNTPLFQSLVLLALDPQPKGNTKDPSWDRGVGLSHHYRSPQHTQFYR